jgi:hypothetical protein
MEQKTASIVSEELCFCCHGQLAPGVDKNMERVLPERSAKDYKRRNNTSGIYMIKILFLSGQGCHLSLLSLLHRLDQLTPREL